MNLQHKILIIKNALITNKIFYEIHFNWPFLYKAND